MSAHPREAVGRRFDPGLMQRARERSWAVVEAIRARMQAGMSEDDAKAMATDVFREHAVQRLWHPPIIRIGANTTKTYRQRSNPALRLAEQDIYFIDLGLVFEHHEGDVGDTFVFGECAARQACATAARTLFDEVAARWRIEGLSGQALYAFAHDRAQAMGWQLNHAIKGHRVGDFPHAVHKAGALGTLDGTPSPGLWVLEIQTPIRANPSARSTKTCCWTRPRPEHHASRRTRAMAHGKPATRTCSAPCVCVRPMLAACGQRRPGRRACPCPGAGSTYPAQGKNNMESCPSLHARSPRRSLARHPLAAACIATLLAFGARPALAQDQANPPPDPNASPQAAAGTATNNPDAQGKHKPQGDVSNLSTVVVTGIRGSIESSLKAKQNADDIIEAISAEDIGKLPDASIAESLARVPGLATQRVDGRANMISIRGLSPDFAGTTLNGREQATIGENRGVEYDQYPSELISGAAIYKTPDASLIGQGLSGTVDLHTIRPLDLPHAVLTMNLRGEVNSNDKLTPGSGVGDTGHRLSFSWIDQFLDHTLGVAVGFAQLDSPIQEKQYQAWWWSVDNGPAGIDQNWGGPHTPGMPDGVISQEGMQLRAQSQRQLRNGLMAVLEWAPGEHYHSTLDLYYSTFGDKKFTNGAQWSSSPYDNVSYSNVGTTAAQPYPIVTSGTVDGIAPILQNQYTKEHDKLFSAGWNNQYDFGNGWAASADLSYSSAKRKLHDAYLFAGLPGGALTSADVVTKVDGGYPWFVPGVNLADPTALAFTDPDNYGYDGREEFDRQKDTIKAVRLEVTHPLGWIFSDVALGVDYSDRVKNKQADVNFAWLNGNGSTKGTYDNTLGAPIGFVDGITSLRYGGIPGIVYYDVLGALRNQFYTTPRNGRADYNRNYTVQEKVPLAYAKFNIDTTLGAMPLRGNVGAQFVHTDQSSSALQTNGDTLVGRIADGDTYNKLLPSLNLVAQLTDRQYLRFGLAKTMARGRIDDEKVATSASVSQIKTGPAAGQVLWSGSGGNPQLRPYVAVGTDLSYEFYFGTSSYLAAAVFNKNLLNYIYTQTTLDYDFSHYTNDNPTLTPTSNIGSFTRPENGTGGRMQGLELSGALEGGLITPALTGFGLQANFSLTNSSIPQGSISAIPGGPKTLPGLSRKVANLTVYYENHGFSVRVAERYRSSFTGEAVALFDQLGYTQVQANKQTDLQLGYDFGEGRWQGLSLLLQVNNLTDTPDETQQISGLPNNVQIARPLEYDTFGRTVMFGVNYKL